jgi:hypothetical protein
MPFASDAQRRWFFANNPDAGDASEAGIPSFTVPTTAEMDDLERSYGEMWDESPDFVRNPGFKRELPQLTDAEKLEWARYRGEIS